MFETLVAVFVKCIPWLEFEVLNVTQISLLLLAVESKLGTIRVCFDFSLAMLFSFYKSL